MASFSSVVDTSPAGHPTSRELWDRLILSGSSSGDDDEQQQDVLVAALNRLGDREPVDWALRGLDSDQTWTRTASAWVLGEHGFNEDYPWRTEAARALTLAVHTEQDDETRATMVRSLTQAGSQADADTVLGFARDPSADVRFEVAAGVPTIFDFEQISPRAAATLIELTRDEDPDIRDWATFSLGTLSDLDSAAIRAALTDRLDDPGEGNDPDDGLAIREEALMGLARRHDPLAFTRLRDWLSGPPHEVTDLVIEAAGELADPRLLPVLETLQRNVLSSAKPRDPLDDATAALQSP